MPDRPFALSIVPPSPPPAEDDYDAICATMMGSARGRWFLEEYARRNRNADTTLVLAAIERLETGIRGEREQHSFEGFRAQLLDMAKAITMTRAEVAAIAPQAPAEPDAPGSPPDNVLAASASPHVLAAAERIADVAWTMRERGIDPKTCDQIEALAASILKAPFLHQADDQRAQQLGEVLVYLERRVNGMLEACAPAPAVGETQAAPEPDITSPPEPQPESVAVRPAELEAGPAASQPIEQPEPEAVVAMPVEDAVVTNGRSVESEIGSTTADIPDSVEIVAKEALSPPADLPPAASGEPASAPGIDAASTDAAPISAEAAPPDSPAAETAAVEVPASEAVSPDVLLGPMPLPVSLASSTELVVSQPPAAAPEPEAVVAPAQPAATPAPRLTTRDPLAFLKAMSPEERIALFT
jgi:hypothetical protein